MLGSRAYLAWGVPHPILITCFLWHKPHSHVQAWCRSQASWIWQDAPTLCREESINMTAPLCFSFSFCSTSYVVNVQKKSILQTTSDGVPMSSSFFISKCAQNRALYRQHKLYHLSCSQQNCARFLEACSCVIQPCLFFHQPRNPEGPVSQVVLCLRV